jgi:site-specific DNA recombinase
MIALGYARRSKEASERTVSLDDQHARIAAYCAEHGWSLADVITDDGVSGGRRERLDRIAAAVKHHRAGAIVVYHLDRYARDVAGMLDALRSLSRRGVELHVVGRGRVEVDTAGGFLMAGVEGLMAEHFRRLIGEKTRDALAHLRAAGRRTSRFPPYGWRFGAAGRLVVEADEQAALVQIAALSAGGLSLRAVSRVLAERGVLARNGRPFAARTLSRLVTNRPVS